MSGLKNLIPVTITEAMLTATNIAENDYTAWSNATTYAAGNRVIQTHKIWESALSSNLNHDPDDGDVDGDGVAYWNEVSATNRWKMFDQYSSSETTSATTIEVSIEPGDNCDGLAILNATGTTAEVEVRATPGGIVLETRTVDLVSVEGDQLTELIMLELPTGATVEINVTINGTNTALGGLVVGEVRTLGTYVLQGARVSIRDYSRKEEDDFGNVVFVERPYAKRMNLELLIDNADFAKVYRWFAAVRARPTLWIGSTKEILDPMLIWGWPGEVEIAVRYVDHCFATVRIEGLT